MGLQRIAENQRYRKTNATGFAAAPVVVADLNAVIDFVNTAANIRTVSYIVGVAGVAGCNHSFTSAANTTEQSIQLGGTTIIPAASPVIRVVAQCLDGLSGAVTGVFDLGITSGSTEYINNQDLDDTNEMNTTGNLSVVYATATSAYFSMTPSANWNTITAGKWKVWITYIDNSAT